MEQKKRKKKKGSKGTTAYLTNSGAMPLGCKKYMLAHVSVSSLATAK
jgi:hypothetical protein